MRRKFIRFFGYFIIFGVIIFSSCKKDKIPTVITFDASNVNGTFATSGGSVISDGGDQVIDKGIIYSTDPNLTINSNKVIPSNYFGIGDFTCLIKKLTPYKKYYIRAYAKNSIGIGYGDIVSFTTTYLSINFNSSSSYGTMMDIDGNLYKTIQIGTQTWMAENLKATRFRNGDPITYITDSLQWVNATSEGYCRYNNDANYSSIFGLLYNFYAMNDPRLISPAGWHVPSFDEWNTLISYCGGQEDTQKKIEEIGNTHWEGIYTNETTNETGFTALPNGFRYMGKFDNIGFQASWWSTRSDNTTDAWAPCLVTSSIAFWIWPYNIGCGIRCVKD